MMKYTGTMDGECLQLCDAINSIQGIETSESCCGHDRDSFAVWFHLDRKHFQNLHILARVTCPRYGGFPTWSCVVDCNDIHRKDKLSFLLSSGSVMGKKAYEQAGKIARNIYYHLEHENYKRDFEIVE